MSISRVRAALESDVSSRVERLRECTEDQWFDRKSARVKPKDLGPAMCGFANAEGGILLIGLDDDLSDEPDAILREWQQAAPDFTSPPVRAHASVLEIDGGSWVGVIEVESSEGVHETQDGACYLRIGDETRKLSFVQRQELHFDKGQSSFDGQAVHGSSRADLDDALVEAYRSAVGTNLSPDRLLANRGLVTRDGVPTHAGLLMFGADPQSILPGCDVRVLKYRGRDRGHGRSLAVDGDADVWVGGTLAEQIEQAADVLEDWVPSRRALAPDGRFERRPVIPRDVWLEALVNAVVHRSYSLSGDHIRIEVFDDRIEVTSPGRFPGLVRLDDPENVARFSRNPRIARVMVDLQIVREMGEGIRRMYAEMRESGLTDPEYRQTEGSVTVVLRTDSRLPADVLSALPRGGQQALQALRTADRPLSTGDVQEALRVGRPTAIRVLHKLQDLGLVEWRGQSKRDPRATWSVVE